MVSLAGKKGLSKKRYFLFSTEKSISTNPDKELREKYLGQWKKLFFTSQKISFYQQEFNVDLICLRSYQRRFPLVEKNFQVKYTVSIRENLNLQ